MKKKNILIDEYPLLVLPALAAAIGLNEAIALQQLHYWLESPKGGVLIDGERWVYNTYPDWKKDNFPFWSEHTIQRVFQNLEDMGLVVSMQKAEYDRKKYYRIDYAKLDASIMPSWNDGTSQVGTIEDANLDASLTETTTENTAETTPDTLSNAPLEWKLAHEQEITEQDLSRSKAVEEAPRMFEKAFGFGKLPWASNRVWEKLQKFVTDIYIHDRLAFGNYIIWRADGGKYKAMSNKQIRLNPQIFIDTGWPDFMNDSVKQNSEPKAFDSIRQWMEEKQQEPFNG